MDTTNYCLECERLARERDEARDEVKRLEGLILEWYETGGEPPWNALATEAKRIRGEK